MKEEEGRREEKEERGRGEGEKREGEEKRREREKGKKRGRGKRGEERREKKRGREKEGRERREERGRKEERREGEAGGGEGRGESEPEADSDRSGRKEESVKEDESCQTALATFTTRLWELGLTVGASVRSTSEFLSEAAEDVSIATTYLESRCLWGNGRLYAQARMHFAQTLDPRRFFRDKMLELARRHQKFEDTPYSLEPNIKESPGGLRDLQVFLWCAQAAGIAQSVSDMASAGLITEREMHTLVACEHHLESLRITLHLLTHRPENRLLFDVQEALASALGYSASA